jgi:hypothetical protein
MNRMRKLSFQGLAGLSLVSLLFAGGCDMNTRSGSVYSMSSESKQDPQYAPSARFTVSEGSTDHFDPNSVDMEAGVESIRGFLFDW